MFQIVLDLSKNTGDVSWNIVEMMKILLKDTDVDLEQLYEDLRFFCIMLHNCNTENEKYYIAQARYIYLKNHYGIYFED
jgi:hypothetical protein